MNHKLNRYECDRCGNVAEVPIVDVLTASNEPDPPPDGWAVLTFRSATDPMGLEVCGACHDEIVDLITKGHLVHIGHASQSGSGKRFTELDLARQENPERWFPVYALMRNGRAE